LGSILTDNHYKGVISFTPSQKEIFTLSSQELNEVQQNLGFILSYFQEPNFPKDYHANVDRIWSEWQNKHPTEYPNGLGCKSDPKAQCDLITIPGHNGYAWALDPHNKNEPDSRNIQQLGYSYG